MPEAGFARRVWTPPALLRAMGVLCAAAAPLVYVPFMRDGFVLGKMFPVAIGAVLLWLAAAMEGRNPCVGRALGRPIAALWVVLTVSAFLSVDLGLSLLGPHQQQYHALLPLLLVTLTYLGAAGHIAPCAAGRTILAAATAAALVAVAQKLGGFQGLAFSVQSGRAGATFGSPIFLGALLALAMPLAVSEFLEGRRLVGGIAAAALLLGLAAARSRGGLLAGLLGSGLYLALRGHVRRSSYIVAIFVTAGAGAWIFARGARFDSDVGRLEVWRVAIAAWRAYPVLGWGPDTFPLAFHRLMTARFVEVTHNDFTVQLSAHNDLLQALATTGLAGLTAYVALLAAAARLAYAARLRPGAAAAAGSIFALFVQAKVNPVPLAVLALAAVLVAALETGTTAPRSRGVAAGGALAAMALVGLVGRLCYAEVLQKRADDLFARGETIAAAEAVNQAAQVNPVDATYAQRQFNVLYALIPHYPPTGQRQAALALLRLTAQAVRLHPQDPVAHETRALALKVATAVFRKNLMPQARAAIDQAAALAPRFGGYRWQKEHMNDFLVKR